MNAIFELFFTFLCKPVIGAAVTVFVSPRCVAQKLFKRFIFRSAQTVNLFPDDHASQLMCTVYCCVRLQCIDATSWV